MTDLKPEFIESIRKQFSEECVRNLITALDGDPVTAVRLNPLKSGVLSFEGEPVLWCREGILLHERPLFASMPQWHGGAFYVQEPASMVISEVVRYICRQTGDRPLCYLDSCAAPGGKTTAAISALPQNSFVVANEFVGTRANILAENVAKWGSPNVAVTQGDTQAFRKLTDTFDIVAVDAPCSGEGMMRKDAEARRQWSTGLIEQCAALQRDILNNVWPALKPGGYLIYSTCTFNRRENEDMLAYIRDELGGEPVDTGLNMKYNIPASLDVSLPALRFMPHITIGEGLFMGIMRKPGVPEASQPTESRKKNDKGITKAIPELESWLKESNEYRIDRNKQGIWRAVPIRFVPLVYKLESLTKVISAGVTLGEEKGKNIIPDAALALSTALNEKAFPSIELNEEKALKFLRREAMVLPESTPRGYVLVTYDGLPLGFMKNLGNRANNLYPQHWRLRNL